MNDMLAGCVGVWVGVWVGQGRMIYYLYCIYTKYRNYPFWTSAIKVFARVVVKGFSYMCSIFKDCKAHAS